MKNTNTKPNHLINEKSPYLLQHAYNPVNWHPWGEEAIETARNEGKPLLVSIGYSTCHWCHVMEEESFSDPGVADIMNQHFICIKIDREERPDLDKIYISAVSAMTGSAGWPLNVFLEPVTLKPFYGGTYFPPESRPGIASWPTLLINISEAWHDKEKKKKLLNSAETIVSLLKNNLSGTQNTLPDKIGDHTKSFDSAYVTFQKNYDKKLGGFSKAPKFPSPSNLDFLLFYSQYAKARHGKTDGAQKSLAMALHTLKAMASGGIYDHLGGGFHRYSTDERWHVPHFEKMLYDNAQLVSSYIAAYRITGENFYREIAEQTIEYVLRDMTHPEGGFYSAEDADSHPNEGEGKKEEGAFYVWAKNEIEALLGPQLSNIYCYRYDVKSNGNAMYDSTGEFKLKNILYIAHTIKETAVKFNKSEDEINDIVSKANKKLFCKRNTRPRPHLDDKIITEWNGLMISALSKAFQATGNFKHLEAATIAAEFIKSELYSNDSKNLYRIWRAEDRKISGLANDYAFLIRGLIDLYEAGFHAKWLAWAIDLAEEMLKLFYDSKNGGFYMTREGQDKNILMRVKEDSDNVIPSAGSVSAENLIRLSRYTGRKDFLHAAEKTIEAVMSGVKKYPASAPVMLTALGELLAEDKQIIITGDVKEDETRKLLNKATSWLSSGKTVIYLDNEDNRKVLSSIVPYTENVKTKNNGPTAYVCINHACRPPVENADELEQMLGGKF